MSENTSRTKKSLRNTIFGMTGMFCSLVVMFISRSIFVKLLGAEYNGINGLFSNILQVLNLAELGFATSVAYALYKPLKDGDKRTTAALMSFIAKIYRIIAVVVTVAGCCCIPILQYLIAEDISELPFSLNELRGYFTMYLASTVCSFLLAYKRTIITADQNNYLVSNGVKGLPINDSKVWVHSIVQLTKMNRHDIILYDRAMAFDITNVVLRLREYYFSRMGAQK